MFDSVKFFLDQNVHHSVAGPLRLAGIDVVTAYEVGRCGFEDPDQLVFAETEGRVIVTYDQDYLVLHAAGHSHAGIAWTPATKYSIGELAEMLETLHGVYTATDMKNHLEYL